MKGTKKNKHKQINYSKRKRGIGKDTMGRGGGKKIVQKSILENQVALQAASRTSEY